jgi:hypothetical protein
VIDSRAATVERTHSDSPFSKTLDIAGRFQPEQRVVARYFEHGGKRFRESKDTELVPEVCRIRESR